MPLHIKTPLIHSLPLSKKLNASVFLKLDNLQPSGSFKLRGIGHLCETLQAKNIDFLVSSSGGNAGLATAYSAQQLGMKATIVVPKKTPEHVIRVMREEYGANVVLHGDEWSQAHQYAQELVKEHENSYLVHPFDDPVIFEGHSTLVSELKEEPIFRDRAPSCILSVVGGGGLITGICEGLRREHWENTPVFALETRGCHTYHQSVQSGSQVRFKKMTSRASTLAGNPVCVRSLQCAKEFNIQPYIVSDEEAAKSCIQFAHDHRMLVEMSCGAALSAIYLQIPPLVKLVEEEKQRGVDPIIVVEVCGGRLVSVADLAQWSERSDWSTEEVEEL